MDNALTLWQLAQSLHHIHRYSDDVYWLCSSDFMQIFYLSPGYEKIMGYPSATLIKNPRILDTFLYPADKKNHHPLAEMVLRIKKEGAQARYDETYRIVRGDGKIRKLLDRGHPICNADGECIGITGVACDVTYSDVLADLPLQSLKAFPASDQQRYYLRGKYKRIYLTTAEAKCAFYLLQGKTSKQIGKLLMLSHRTVEDVFTRIKNKLGLNYRSELIEALLLSDFIASLTMTQGI